MTRSLHTLEHFVDIGHNLATLSSSSVTTIRQSNSRDLVNKSPSPIKAQASPIILCMCTNMTAYDGKDMVALADIARMLLYFVFIY